MDGRKLITKILKHEKVERVAWVPFAGAHAGKLKGYSAKTIFHDTDKILECLLAVNDYYSADGQPVFFDLQIAAEILGCSLKWHEKGPPSVDSHPLATDNWKIVPKIPEKLPLKTEGRLPFILHVMKEFKKSVGTETALFGLICGPLTLAAHLRGSQFFMDLIKNKDFAEQLLDYTMHVGKKMSEYYTEVGMDIIAIVDPVVSQVSPRVFKDYLMNPFREILSYIKKQGVFNSFFVCGDATRNLELMAETAPDSIFIDENIDMEYAKSIFGPKNIVLGGNIPLTTVMLYGTQQDNMKYVIDLFDKIGTDDLIVAPGCDMPYEIPLDNVIGVTQAIHEPNKIREILKNYHGEQTETDLELPDYQSLEKPLIEVYTIDSDTCAACQYFKITAFEAKERFQDKIDVKEYKSIYKESIVRAKKMGLKHLPAMVINGKLAYSSIIPDKDQFFEKIEQVID